MKVYGTLLNMYYLQHGGNVFVLRRCYYYLHQYCNRYLCRLHLLNETGNEEESEINHTNGSDINQTHESNISYTDEYFANNSFNYTWFEMS